MLRSFAVKLSPKLSPPSQDSELAKFSQDGFLLWFSVARVPGAQASSEGSCWHFLGKPHLGADPDLQFSKWPWGEGQASGEKALHEDGGASRRRRGFP